MDELMLVAFTLGLAPACGFVWLVIGKTALEMFSSADVQALTEKANPSIVPK